MQTLSRLTGKDFCSYAGQCWPEQSSRRARYSKRCSKGELAFHTFLPYFRSW